MDEDDGMMLNFAIPAIPVKKPAAEKKKPAEEQKPIASGNAHKAPAASQKPAQKASITKQVSQNDEQMPSKRPRIESKPPSNPSSNSSSVPSFSPAPASAPPAPLGVVSFDDDDDDASPAPEREREPSFKPFQDSFYTGRRQSDRPKVTSTPLDEFSSGYVRGEAKAEEEEENPKKGGRDKPERARRFNPYRTLQEEAERSKALSSLEESAVHDGDLFSNTDMKSFGVDDRIIKHMQSDMGISKFTYIQAESLPHIMAGKDVLIKSETGSGKTLAFVVPVLNAIVKEDPPITRTDGCLAIFLAPTRELCLQTYEILARLVKSHIRIVPGHIMGGEKREKEKARLRKGINILVATPGRLLDHLQNTESFSTDALKHLVFDEADRLLDMGFEKDIASILKILAHRRTVGAYQRPQTVLISATLRDGVYRMASQALENPVRIGFGNVTLPKALAAVEAANAAAESALAAPGARDMSKFDSDDEEEDEEGDDMSQDQDDDDDDEEEEEMEEVVEFDDEKGSDDDDVDMATASKSAISAAQVVSDGQKGALQFVLPKNLNQSYIVVPAKLRLVTLTSFLRWKTDVKKPVKAIVYFSCCDSAEFHYELFSNSFIAGAQRMTLEQRRAAQRMKKESLERTKKVFTDLSMLYGDDSSDEEELEYMYSDDEDDAKMSKDIDSDASDSEKKPKQKKTMRVAKNFAKQQEKEAAMAALKDDDADKEGQDEDLTEDGRIREPIFTVPLFKLHGKMTQKERTDAFFAFCRSDAGILLCTDVAARGLDIPDLNWIIQYDSPGEPKDYIHRVGRTARIGHSGDAVIFLMPSELGYVDLLNKCSVGLTRIPNDTALEMSIKMFGRVHKDVYEAASTLQFIFSNNVIRNPELHLMAAAAYNSHVRAYATHSAATQHIFHVRSLHLGHIAYSFGLRDSPKELSDLMKKHTAKKRLERNKKEEEMRIGKDMNRRDRKALKRKLAGISAPTPAKKQEETEAVADDAEDNDKDFEEAPSSSVAIEEEENESEDVIKMRPLSAPRPNANGKRELKGHFFNRLPVGGREFWGDEGMRTAAASADAAAAKFAAAAAKANDEFGSGLSSSSSSAAASSAKKSSASTTPRRPADSNNSSSNSRSNLSNRGKPLPGKPLRSRILDEFSSGAPRPVKAAAKPAEAPAAPQESFITPETLARMESLLERGKMRVQRKEQQESVLPLAGPPLPPQDASYKTDLQQGQGKGRGSSSASRDRPPQRGRGGSSRGGMQSSSARGRGGRGGPAPGGFKQPQSKAPRALDEFGSGF